MQVSSKNRHFWRSFCCLLSSYLILPNRYLCVNPLDKIHNHLDDNQERSAADRQRRNACDGAHDERKDRYDAEEQRSEDCEPSEGLRKMLGCRLAGAHARDEGAVLLEIGRYLVGIEGDRSVEEGEGKDENEIERGVDPAVIKNTESPLGN